MVAIRCESLIVLCAVSFEIARAFTCMAAHRGHKLRLRAEPEADETHSVEFDKALSAMTAFSNRYVKLTDTKYCSEPSVTSVVIRGLAEHKVTLGAPLCPCRFYEDKQAEAKDGYWNCPCVPMRERKECHCMLFLTEDNEFAGESTDITLEEVNALTA